MQIVFKMKNYNLIWIYVAVPEAPQNTHEQIICQLVMEIQSLANKICNWISKISSLFAHLARRKSKEHAEMPKVWPVHDEV